MEYTRLLESSRSPARCALQNSSTFTMLARLCSNSCRLLTLPASPASTLGLAAASITQSAAGRTSKSLAWRMSPWMNLTPRFRSRTRLISEPGRMEVVDARDGKTFAPFEQRFGDRRPGEAADTRDQDFHRAACGASRCVQLPAISLKMVGNGLVMLQLG
jgi:hypothetical protein